MKGESPFTLIGFLEVNYLLIVELTDALFLFSLEEIKVWLGRERERERVS
jgi:hypothetical protein